VTEAEVSGKFVDLNGQHIRKPPPIGFGAQRAKGIVKIFASAIMAVPGLGVAVLSAFAPMRKYR